MLVLDNEQSTETTALDRLLTDWWAKLEAWLSRQPLPSKEIEEEGKRADHTSLIL